MEAKIESPLVQAKEQQKKHSFLVNLIVRMVKEKPLGTVCAAIVILLIAAGIFADFLAPYPMAKINLMDSLSPPSAKYIFGTDEFGRDILSRVIFGARISMIVSLGSAGISVVVSLAIGLLSGYIGGKLDLAVQRFVDAIMCFPPLFLMLSAMAIVGPGIFQVVMVLGIRYGIVGSRVMRGSVIAIRENVYVDAAKSIGSSTLPILFRHIVPNVMAPLIILFTTRMAAAILVEATLSFLGFGVPPPQPSWGGMMSGTGRDYLMQAPWIALWPGLALTLAVYGISMFGDALRDLLDPRLIGGIGRYGKTKRKVLVRKRAA